MVEANQVIRVDNPANDSMHYNRRVDLGIVEAPDFLPVKQLYSYYDGKRLFQQLDYDTYVMQKDAKPHKGKFPPVLKLIGSILLCSILFKLGRNGIKKTLHK